MVWICNTAQKGEEKGENVKQKLSKGTDRGKIEVKIRNV
jgi:hypothetical protein